MFPKFWSKTLQADKSKIKLYQNEWKGNYGYGKEQLTIQRIAYNVSQMLEAVLWHKNMWHIWFIDDLTTDRCSKMNSDVYRPLIQPNATKLTGKQLTVDRDNDPK